jgi:hypothetical protein
MVYEDMIKSWLNDPQMMGYFLISMVIFVLFAIASYVYFALAQMTAAKKLKTENEWFAWIPIANLFLMAKMAKKAYWPIYLFLAGIAFQIFFGIIGAILFVVTKNSVLLSIFQYTNSIISYAISGILAFYSAKWLMTICERLNKPKEWGLISLVISMFILAIGLINLIFASVAGIIIMYLVIIIGWIWGLIVWGILAWNKTAIEKSNLVQLKSEPKKKPIRRKSN